MSPDKRQLLIVRGVSKTIQLYLINETEKIVYDELVQLKSSNTNERIFIKTQTHDIISIFSWNGRFYFVPYILEEVVDIKSNHFKTLTNLYFVDESEIDPNVFVENAKYMVTILENEEAFKQFPTTTKKTSRVTHVDTNHDALIVNYLMNLTRTTKKQTTIYIHRLLSLLQPGADKHIKQHCTLLLRQWNTNPALSIQRQIHKTLTKIKIEQGSGSSFFWPRVPKTIDHSLQMDILPEISKGTTISDVPQIVPLHAGENKKGKTTRLAKDSKMLLKQKMNALWDLHTKKNVAGKFIKV